MPQLSSRAGSSAGRSTFPGTLRLLASALRLGSLPGLLAFLLAAWALPARAGELEVHFINVGQGNAILVRGPDGTTVLVDGGNPGDGNAIVRPYLNSIGVTTLQYGIVTHWHTDHMGGLDEVFNGGFKPTIAAFDRGNLVIPSNSEVTSYLNSVANPPGLRQTPTPGQTIALGDGATLEITSVNGAYVGGSVDPWSGDQSENAASITCVIRYGDFDCWLSGDLTGGGLSTANVEAPVAFYVGQVEVVESGHHGSTTSSAAVSVALFNPSLVVHSCGEANPYGHPSTVVTDRWNSGGLSRLQWSTTAGSLTSGNGGFVVANSHIVVTSDGATFEARRASDQRRTRFTTFEQTGRRPSLGDLVLSEILVDPGATSDAFGEWFELLNRSTWTLNLGGTRFTSGASQYTVASQILIAPGERLVFGLDGRESRNGGVFLAHCAPWQGFSLANGSGSLEMRNASSTVLETLSWGGGGIAVTSGRSSERIDAFEPPTANNFTLATSAWAGADQGTPGDVNTAEGYFCPIPLSYCVAAPNSAGDGAFLGYSGSVNVVENDLTLISTGRPPGSIGIFFHGPQANQVPFGNGYLCVGGPVIRLGVAIASPGGVATRPVNLAAQATIVAGAKRHFQDWYRNPAGGGAGFNLSNGLEINFCAAADPGLVVISEFLADPVAVPDANGEWIELSSTAAGPIDIEGWILRTDNGNNSHVFSAGGAGVVIPAGGRLVVGRDANPATNGGVAVDYVWPGLTLDDAGDEILLLLPDASTVIDVVNSSQPFFPFTPGRSSSLRPGSIDHLLNDDPFQWCSSQSALPGGDFGTPGQVNESCP